MTISFCDFKFSDDSLKSILFPTMCGACYKNINNCQIVEKEVSLVHLASYLTDSLTFNEKKDRVDIRWQLKNRFPVTSQPCLDGMIPLTKVKISVLVIRSWTCYWFLSLVCWQWKLITFLLFKTSLQIHCILTIRMKYNNLLVYSRNFVIQEFGNQSQ